MTLINSVLFIICHRVWKNASEKYLPYAELFLTHSGCIHIRPSRLENSCFVWRGVIRFSDVYLRWSRSNSGRSRVATIDTVHHAPPIFQLFSSLYFAIWLEWEREKKWFRTSVASTLCLLRKLRYFVCSVTDRYQLATNLLVGLRLF